MICPNMRAAQVYVRDAAPDRMTAIVRETLAEPRVDQLMWRTALTRPGTDGYTVATRRGVLEFSRALHRGTPDAFGGRWEWRGEPRALGLDHHDGRDRVRPVPERVRTDRRRARPRTERRAVGDCATGVRVRSAGRKGARRRRVARRSARARLAQPGDHRRAPERHRLPRSLRSVDLAPLCMELLGLDMRYRPGMPRSCFFTLTRGVLSARDLHSLTRSTCCSKWRPWWLAALAITGGQEIRRKKNDVFLLTSWPSCKSSPAIELPLRG